MGELISPRTHVINVGALDLDHDLGRELWEGHTAKAKSTVVHAAHSARGLPLTPTRFGELIRTRRFTNGADADFVIAKY